MFIVHDIVLVNEIVKIEFSGVLNFAPELGLSCCDKFFAHEVIQVNIDIGCHSFRFHLFANMIKIINLIIKR